MRGHENPQASMFSYVSLEQRVPKDHPLRTLRTLVDGILANMSALFDERHSHTGRPSIPPEQLLRALLVQILFTIRSERSSWSSSSTTTCCSAGSSAWPLMIRCGITRSSRRIVTASMLRQWPLSF